jgi:hypothetical protein
MQAPPSDTFEYIIGWYYMKQVVAGSAQDVCDNIYSPFEDIMYYDPDVFPAAPPDTDFHNREIFLGYGKCRYHGNENPDVAGFIVCDSFLGASYCVRDDRDTFECRGDIPAGEMAPTLTPRLTCTFPVLSG